MPSDATQRWATAPPTTSKPIFKLRPNSVRLSWTTSIFEVKRLFFEEEQPDIVEHFIKQEHSVEERYASTQNTCRYPITE